MSETSPWYVPAGHLAQWSARPTREIPGRGGHAGVRFPVPEVDALVALAHSLTRAGERWSAVPAHQRIEAVATTAASLRAEDSRLRRAALDAGAGWTGRAPDMLEESFDFFLGKLTRAELAREAERAGLLATPAERLPRLTAHWLAGNTPWAGLESLVAACLAGSASLVKLARGEPFFPSALARALAAAHPALGAALAILYWKGGEAPALEDALVAECQALVAFGDDATVESLAARAAPRAASGALRFVGHGHRLSVAVLASEAWRGRDEAAAWAERVAYDHALEDQEGCLSPRGVYLVGPDEAGAGTAAVHFALHVAEAMAGLERRWPRAAIPAVEAAQVQQLRRLAELSGDDLWQSPETTAWTVRLDRSDRFEPAPAARFVWLHRVASFEAAARAMAPAASRLAALGWGAPRACAEELPRELRALAPGFVAPVGRMQRPPLGWNHDGASDLEWLVRPPSPSPRAAGERSS